MTISELEERVAKLEYLMQGDLKTLGVVPLLVDLANDMHGPDGKSGMRKELHDVSQAVHDAKVASKTASAIFSFIGGLLGAGLMVLLNHVLK